MVIRFIKLVLKKEIWPGLLLIAFLTWGAHLMLQGTIQLVRDHPFIFIFIEFSFYFFPILTAIGLIYRFIKEEKEVRIKKDVE